MNHSEVVEEGKVAQRVHHENQEYVANDTHGIPENPDVGGVELALAQVFELPLDFFHSIVA